LKMEGAHTAAPIWANFMKRAVLLPQYSDTKEFVPPPGVSVVRIDKVTNLLADASCPVDYDVAFLDGTAPTDTCDRANVERTLMQRLFGIGKQTAVAPGIPGAAQPGLPVVQAAPQSTVNAPPATPPTPAATQDQQQQKKKKGFFGKIFGAIKGSDDDGK
jgi:penicillin-binding protein 1B